MKVPRWKLCSVLRSRQFSTSRPRLEIRSIDELPDRIQPSYHETRGHDLLSLKWPSPPRNILLIKKENTSKTTEAVLEFAKHVQSTYPNISLILEAPVATALHSLLPFPIYTTSHPTSKGSTNPSPLPHKVDLTTTFGGDGTILHASSLFSTSSTVPPILSFSMGTLGFLNEWKFPEHKRAFRELYMSGSSSPRSSILSSSTSPSSSSPPWDPTLGASLGPTRSARILLRNRLRVSFHPPPGAAVKDQPPLHALNELILHRGASPHLTHLVISLHTGTTSRILTTAVADGLIISTPTGSTAYSLSAGGSIVHPLVKAMIVTPVCPRSLSFRPLVLPVGAVVGLRLAERGRGEGCDVSVDGVRREGLGIGGEVRVWGEEVGRGEDVRGEPGGRDRVEFEDVDGIRGSIDDGVESQRADAGRGWVGGVPCVMRGSGGEGASGDEGWVGGLNGLLKFNYPFGEEEV